jgi:cytochrome c556
MRRPCADREEKRVTRGSAHPARKQEQLDLKRPNQRGHSEARPTVWERWPEFEAASQNVAEEAAKLADAARSGEEAAIAAQFRSMTQACSGCHDVFRAKR